MSGERLKQEIEQLGLTTAKFSRLSDISTRTLSKIYNNETVRKDTLHKAWNFLAALKAEMKAELRSRARARQDAVLKEPA